MLSTTELLVLHPVVLGFAVAVAGATFLTLATTRATDAATGYEHESKGKPVPYLPGGHLGLGHTLVMARNLDRFQDWLVDTSVARQGRPFVLRQPGKNDWLFTARPQDFEQILRIQVDTFIKGPQVRDLLADFMGENIVLINGARWKFHRQALEHLFTARALRDHMTPIVQKCTVALEKVVAQAAKDGHEVDLHRLMGRFTLETFGEIEFGTSLGLLDSEHDHAFERALDEAHHIALERFAVPTWVWKLKRWLNVGSERRLRSQMQVISTFVTNCISDAIARRKQRMDAIARGEVVPAASAQDIISILLDPPDATKTGQTVHPTDVFHIALAGVLAGKDTTGDALSWLMHLLHENPRVESRLRSELRRKLPNLALDTTYVPTLDEVDNIPYLEATIRESLRLKPPAPCITQHCAQDTTFPDGTFIPRGTDTTLLYQASALLPSVWGPNAHEFHPERFLDETENLIVLPPHKFIAFSAGPRKCVGRRLAMIEMKIVTACLVSRFHLVEVPGQEIRSTMGISLGMKYGMRVRVQPLPS